MNIVSYLAGVSTGVCITTIILIMRDKHLEQVKFEEEQITKAFLNDLRKIKGEL